MDADPTLEPGDPSLEDAVAVVARLGTDPERGLASREAADRLLRDGPNELRPTPPVPLWRRVLAQFQDPLVYLLLAAIAISFGAWLAKGSEGVPVDVVVIAAIVVANAVIGLVQEAKAVDAVAALADLTAATSTVVRDGRLVTVPSAGLVVGDLLRLSEGDTVGADARLLGAHGLRVQEAALTGESEATSKDAATQRSPAPVGDRLNMVFGGTAVVQGTGLAVVTSTGMGTEMGAIADMLERIEPEPSPLERQIAAVSTALGLVVIGIAVVVMVAVALANGVHDSTDLVTVLLMGVSLAVAAVPEGLPAILSLVLALGVRAMAERNAVMKDLHSVETLGSASVICSDKTGTLTCNEMTLRAVVTASGEVEVTGAGYEPDGTVLAVPGDPSVAEIALAEAGVALSVGALANDAQLTRAEDGWHVQGDPTEAAFLVALRKLDGGPERVRGFRRSAEVPFTSQRKMMSVSGLDVATGTGVVLAKGAPDVLLDRCTSIRVGDRVRPLEEPDRERVLAAVRDLSARAYRTLGVAYRTLDGAAPAGSGESLERDLVHVGVVGLLDPPREEASTAVREAQQAGIRTIMITGDHPGTAGRIATDVGIIAPEGAALTGADLDALDDEGLVRAVRDVSVFARVAPAHKLRIVDALHADGSIVAMTGDGVNDAPALKAADIGIAMGITGTEVTKDAATMILGDDNYATIVAAVRRGRVIFANIAKFLRYLLSSNLGEVATVFFGVVLATPLGLADASAPGTIVLPLLATQILWINLVTDGGPALAMGVDPELDDVMARPPRRPTDRILDRSAWARIIGTGLVMGAVTLLSIDVFLPGGLVEGGDSLEVARTVGFTTLVFAQLFNALNSRSTTTTAFRGLFSNRWLTASLVVAVVLQLAVVEVPFLQQAFGTSSLDVAHLAVAVALASVVLWVEEGAKLVRRIAG